MMVAAITLFSGVAAFNSPLARAGRPNLGVSRARCDTPVCSTYEQYLKDRAAMGMGAEPAAQPSTKLPPPDVSAAVAGVVAPTAPIPVETAPIRRTMERPDMSKVVHDASDLLSHQAIMENFVHHNPWESLQHMEFFEALEYVEEKQSFMSPGERISQLAPLDPRTRANKAVAEMGAPFLDRGLAKWEPPFREKGFLYFFARTEGLGNAPWRGYARQAAKAIKDIIEANPEMDVEQLATQILEENLEAMEEDKSLWEQTTRAMMLDLPGWAGMFKRMEEHPEEGPGVYRNGELEPIPVHLSEFIAVHSIMARSSIEAQAKKIGWTPDQSLCKFLRKVPYKRRGPKEIYGMGKEMESLQNPSGLAFENQNFNMVEELERKYADITLRAVNKPGVSGGAIDGRGRVNLQFYTCFDEREESFRRYLEEGAYGPNEVETYGVAGFFNMAIRYKPANLRPEEILAPEGNCPPLDHKVVESELNPAFRDRKKLQAEISRLFEMGTYSPLGSLAIAGGLMPYSFTRLMLRSFAPELTMDLEDTFASSVVGQSATDFAPPYTAEEAATRLAQLFKNIGSNDNFARMVVVTGHGARSVNNPFLAAYNCGACCGREGGPNARVFARCANDPAVRALLSETHNVHIPDDTWFVGGYHDTTSDLVELYDLDRIPPSHTSDFARAKQLIDEARAKNALERCDKFMLTDAATPADALKHVEMRSRDIAEVRPELGHSTNAAIFVGRRELTKGRFLDRRVFLPTYDPFNDDDEGTNLMTVLTPALVVGSGISLEYFFSTVDGGAGTKAPVNVVGNFGLQQGTAGDLLIGLATQMSELHSPQRALYLIDAPVERVEKCLARNQVLMNLVRNNWVNFHVRDPYTQQIFKQVDGEYVPVDVASANADGIDFVPFTPHTEYLQTVKREEDIYTAIAAAAMVASTLPIFVTSLLGSSTLDFHPLLISTGATALGLSNLAYSRRYLHGEFMYGRMALISAAMVAGFNMVAAAPSLEGALLGWTIIGFSSTFLIGGFNDRPTARDNAAYAFSAYQVSDAMLLMAAAFTTVEHSGAVLPANADAVASFGLIIAAAIKSSQFPLAGLFLRSMEGASPNSALGYAGISAHAGIVLLAGTMSTWGQFDWAHNLLAVLGALTVVQSGIIANVRADRKGGVASASSATLGMLFILLSAGQADLALFLALGHASFRMNQIVRAAGAIQDSHKWEESLGKEKMASDRVFDVLWEFGWGLQRVNSDWLRLPDYYANVDLKQAPIFYNAQVTQIIAALLTLSLTAVVHLPSTDESIGDLMIGNPAAAFAILAANAFISTALIRFLFGNVLDFGRFRK